MQPLTLELLADVIRSHWSVDTCDPADRGQWTPENSARGQCGVTALVINDYFGGVLLLAPVTTTAGESAGWHYWNRLSDGTEVDLTLEQFGPDEHVGQAEVLERPAGPPRRCRVQYETLSARVRQSLHVPEPTGDKV